MKRYTIGAILLILLVTAAAFFGSGYFKRQLAYYAGHSTICVDGVKYVQFVSGASVKYNVDGTIARCD